MWSFKRPLRSSYSAPLVALVALSTLAACTVEPLRGARSTIGSGVVSDNLLATSVAEVNTRVAQQVRNELLFALHGGKSTVTPRYQVKLGVTATASALSIRSSSLAPTSARVVVNASYTATEIATNRVVARGTRRTFAAYDRTTQSFANERAERDAENRAAKEIAQQIRLALGQQLSGG